MTKWDKRFLDLAYHISGWSKDPSTQCGAVIVRPDRTIACTGYNGFPRNMYDTPRRYDNREEKYPRVIHAEMNAILTAKEPLTGYTLYVTPFSPCDRCATHIIQSGIKKVVCPTGIPQGREHWREAFERTQDYFLECNVIFERVNWHP